jgi:hypothetical protein
VAQLFSLGDFTFMKTQRTFGILWLALFILIISLWLWKLIRGDDVSGDLGFHPLAGLVYVFGVIASAYLIQGARWARIAIGIMALAFAVLVVIAMLASRRWHSADGCVGVFALVSALILLFPRHEPVA